MVEHSIRIRDLRLRFGAPEVFAAQCSCGWMGEERRGGITGEIRATWDGRRHVERELHLPRRRADGSYSVR
jgi:hypothetical protein